MLSENVQISAKTLPYQYQQSFPDVSKHFHKFGMIKAAKKVIEDKNEQIQKNKYPVQKSKGNL